MLLLALVRPATPTSPSISTRGRAGVQRYRHPEAPRSPETAMLHCPVRGLPGTQTSQACLPSSMLRRGRPTEHADLTQILRPPSTLSEAESASGGGQVAPRPPPVRTQAVPEASNARTRTSPCNAPAVSTSGSRSPPAPSPAPLRSRRSPALQSVAASRVGEKTLPSCSPTDRGPCSPRSPHERVLRSGMPCINHPPSHTLPLSVATWWHHKCANVVAHK